MRDGERETAGASSVPAITHTPPPTPSTDHPPIHPISDSWERSPTSGCAPFRVGRVEARAALRDAGSFDHTRTRLGSPTACKNDRGRCGVPQPQGGPSRRALARHRVTRIRVTTTGLTEGTKTHRHRQYSPHGVPERDKTWSPNPSDPRSAKTSEMIVRHAKATATTQNHDWSNLSRGSNPKTTGRRTQFTITVAKHVRQSHCYNPESRLEQSLPRLQPKNNGYETEPGFPNTSYMLVGGQATTIRATGKHCSNPRPSPPTTRPTEPNLLWNLVNYPAATCQPQTHPADT